MKKLFPILFWVTVLLLCFIISANVTGFDFDLWARLIAGMGVIDGHTVLKTDFLSYTPTHTWWDHEYGSGVIFYFFLKYLGPYSLIILQTFICFFIFFTIGKIIELRGEKKPFNFLFWIFPIISVSANFGSPVRCHLFSFLLFSVFIYILESVRRGKTKLIYILPALVILWNNLHGGVVAGIGLIALFGLGQILEKKPFKHYIYAGLLSLAVLVINPWGLEYIKFLFMANLMARPDVMEWWGIFSKHQLGNQIPFKIFLFIAIILESIAYFRRFKTSLNNSEFWQKLDKTKFILLITTLYLSVSHVKLIPFFVIIACAYCFEDFRELWEYLLPKWSAYITTIAVMLVCILGLSIKEYEIPLGANIYPHREVEFIKINNIKGNLLVNFGLGSFVSYKLYPQNKIFMDGRYEEVYYEEMVPLLKKFYLLKSDWDEVLRKYPPDIMIIENYYPVYIMLNKHPDWINIYSTETYGVFVKKDILQSSYIQPSSDPLYYKNTLFDTSIKF